MVLTVAMMLTMCSFAVAEADEMVTLRILCKNDFNSDTKVND